MMMYNIENNKVNNTTFLDNCVKDYFLLKYYTCTI